MAIRKKTYIFSHDLEKKKIKSMKKFRNIKEKSIQSLLQSPFNLYFKSIHFVDSADQQRTRFRLPRFHENIEKTTANNYMAGATAPPPLQGRASTHRQGHGLALIASRENANG